jgi:hypothetical protein
MQVHTLISAGAVLLAFLLRQCSNCRRSGVAQKVKCVCKEERDKLFATTMIRSSFVRKSIVLQLAEAAEGGVGQLIVGVASAQEMSLA